MGDISLDAAGSDGLAEEAGSVFAAICIFTILCPIMDVRTKNRLGWLRITRKFWIQSGNLRGYVRVCWAHPNHRSTHTHTHTKTNHVYSAEMVSQSRLLNMGLIYIPHRPREGYFHHINSANEPEFSPAVHWYSIDRIIKKTRIPREFETRIEFFGQSLFDSNRNSNIGTLESFRSSHGQPKNPGPWEDPITLFMIAM